MIILAHIGDDDTTMLHGEALGILVGAVALGAVHGLEPGHGWPVAASYALDQANKWVYGFAASFILGIGHLISSIAMVAVFFYAKSYFNLTQVNEPIHLLENVIIGGPVSIVAGVLLIALGIREYRHGHSHGRQRGEHDHDHDHDANHHHQNHGDDGDHPHHDHGHHHHDHDPGHSHDHSHPPNREEDGVFHRLKGYLPFVSGHSHSHDNLDEAADRGLLGIAWFAFLLGFAHEEEFEIIALCAGSDFCLELMSAYAITVIVGIVGLTMLLIAGYEHFEEKVEQYTPYLPAFSATVLILMGAGFITGLL
jgi:Mn2+/Fe2+ NRAMP family transporter